MDGPADRTWGVRCMPKCGVGVRRRFVFDIYAKYVPQPVDIKTQQSVYDHYDILEEIGTGAFGVVHRCRLEQCGF